MSEVNFMSPATRDTTARLIDGLDNNFVMDAHAKTIRRLVHYGLPKNALRHIDALRDDLRLLLMRCDQLEALLREVSDA